jgi:hypothetical protein
MNEPSFLSAAQTSVSLASRFNTWLCSLRRRHLSVLNVCVTDWFTPHDLPSQDAKLVNCGHRVLAARGPARKRADWCSRWNGVINRLLASGLPTGDWKSLAGRLSRSGMQAVPFGNNPSG